MATTVQTTRAASATVPTSTMGGSIEVSASSPNSVSFPPDVDAVVVAVAVAVVVSNAVTMVP